MRWSNLNFRAALPPMDGTYRPILRVRPGGELKVIVLGDHLYAVTTHWAGGHEIPCLLPSVPCACLKKPLNRRWSGYLAAVTLDKATKVGILPVTYNAARTCALDLQRPESLRGIVLTSRKDKGGACAPCWLSVGEQFFASDRLPPPFDVEQALIRLWDGQIRAALESAGELPPQR